MRDSHKEKRKCGKEGREAAFQELKVARTSTLDPYC